MRRTFSGGLTPSPGLLTPATAGARPVYVMIRPRSGDFIFSRDEENVMRREIDSVAVAFAHCPTKAGLVLGASMPDGRLDTGCLERLLDHARRVGLECVTLHRAFDLTPNPLAALEEAILLGFERILTSGCATTAPAGSDMLSLLHEKAAAQIKIMAGDGLSPDNVAALMSATGITELHASCSEPASILDPRAAAFGFGSRPALTSAARVRSMRDIITSPR